MTKTQMPKTSIDQTKKNIENIKYFSLKDEYVLLEYEHISALISFMLNLFRQTWKKKNQKKTSSFQISHCELWYSMLTYNKKEEFLI